MHWMQGITKRTRENVNREQAQAGFEVLAVLLLSFSVSHHCLAASTVLSFPPPRCSLAPSQSEDPDDDSSKAIIAGCCLTNIAAAVGNDIIQAPSPVLGFIESHIQSGNWREREAATMAFGACAVSTPTPFIAHCPVSHALCRELCHCLYLFVANSNDSSIDPIICLSVLLIIFSFYLVSLFLCFSSLLPNLHPPCSLPSPRRHPRGSRPGQHCAAGHHGLWSHSQDCRDGRAPARQGVGHVDRFAHLHDLPRDHWRTDAAAGVVPPLTLLHS
jgi:hypothetical protein